jgi:hypothetical protein
VLLTNGRIYTLDAAGSVVDSLVVADAARPMRRKLKSPRRSR